MDLRYAARLFPASFSRSVACDCFAAAEWEDLGYCPRNSSQPVMEWVRSARRYSASSVSGWGTNTSLTPAFRLGTLAKPAGEEESTLAWSTVCSASSEALVPQSFSNFKLEGTTQVLSEPRVNSRTPFGFRSKEVAPTKETFGSLP